MGYQSERAEYESVTNDCKKCGTVLLLCKCPSPEITKQEWDAMSHSKGWNDGIYMTVNRYKKMIDGLNKKLDILENADKIQTTQGMEDLWTPANVALMKLLRSFIKEEFGE